MSYYLDLFTPETWAAFREHAAKVSGFREHQRKTADHVRPGDKFICDLVRLSRWCGILEVKSKAFVDSSPIFSDPDPFIIRGLREIEWVNFGGGSAKNLCIG
jgi:hypothetical protein